MRGETGTVTGDFALVPGTHTWAPFPIACPCRNAYRSKIPFSLFLLSGKGTATTTLLPEAVPNGAMIFLWFRQRKQKKIFSSLSAKRVFVVFCFALRSVQQQGKRKVAFPLLSTFLFWPMPSCSKWRKMAKKWQFFLMRKVILKTYDIGRKTENFNFTCSYLPRVWGVHFGVSFGWTPILGSAHPAGRGGAKVIYSYILCEL